MLFMFIFRKTFFKQFINQRNYSKMSGLDAEFEKLKENGKNTVKNIVDWMKEAKVVNEKFTEQQAKKMFEATDETKIELEKFKDVVGKIAVEQKKSLETVAKQLQESSGQFLKAFQAGISAFQNALKDK